MAFCRTGSPVWPPARVLLLEPDVGVVAGRPPAEDAVLEWIEADLEADTGAGGVEGTATERGDLEAGAEAEILARRLMKPFL
jgi:hypothetical protein